MFASQVALPSYGATSVTVHSTDLEQNWLGFRDGIGKFFNVGQLPVGVSGNQLQEKALKILD